MGYIAFDRRENSIKIGPKQPSWAVLDHLIEFSQLRFIRRANGLHCLRPESCFGPVLIEFSQQKCVIGVVLPSGVRLECSEAVPGVKKGALGSWFSLLTRGVVGLDFDRGIVGPLFSLFASEAAIFNFFAGRFPTGRNDYTLHT
jgi:hypothetical protein